MHTISTQLLAQVINPQLGSAVRNLSGWEFINNIIAELILLGLIVGCVAFFFMLLSGGIDWISSAGNKQKLEDARRKIMHALIGLLILFSIFVVVKLINTLFGIDIGGLGGGNGGGTTQPGAPSCYISGSTNVCDSQPVSFTANCSDYSDLTRIDLYWSPAGTESWSPAFQTCSFASTTSGTCTGSESFTTPGDYYVVVNGYSGDGNCSGNPWCSWESNPWSTTNCSGFTNCNANSSRLDALLVHVNDCTGVPPIPATCADLGSACACDCPIGYVPSDDLQCNQGYNACVGQSCECVRYEDRYPPGLYLHYNLNEGSGTTVHDSSGNGYNTNLRDPAGDTWNNNGCGGSITFDGDTTPLVQDAIQPDQTQGGAFWMPSGTLAAWINPAISPIVRPYIYSIIDNNSSFFIATSRGPTISDPTFRVEAGISQSRGNGYESNTVLTANSWHHVATTYDEQTQLVRIYIDGSLDFETTTPPPDYDIFSQCPVGVGRNCYPGNDLDLFRGMMDDVRIYNYALSPTEISNLYNSCAPVVPTPVPNPFVETICNDGLDNDNDSFIDCSDADCNNMSCSISNPALRCIGGICQ